MTYLDQSHQGMNHRREANAAARQAHTSESAGGVRHLTFTDIVLLTVLAVGGFVASEHLGSASRPATDVRQPVKQTMCSDEELRQMRSGPETCYDEPSLHHKKSDLSGSPSPFNNT